MKKLITSNFVFLDLEAESKEDVIRQLSEAIAQDGRLSDTEGYIEDVLKREEKFSTSVGFSVATPHAKSKHVKDISLAFTTLKEKILWDEEEEEWVTLVFQLAVPAVGQSEDHLRLLALLSRKLIHDDFRNSLKNAKEPEDVLALLEDLM